jgi:hypothetical protein
MSRWHTSLPGGQMLACSQLLAGRIGRSFFDDRAAAPEIPGVTAPV